MTINETVAGLNKHGLFKKVEDGVLKYLSISGDDNKRYFLNNTRVFNEDGSPRLNESGKQIYAWTLGAEMGANIREVVPMPDDSDAPIARVSQQALAN